MSKLNRREALASWRLAIFADTRTDVEDRIALGDLLDRLGLLPEQTWMPIHTELLGDDQVTELCAAVRAIAERNGHLREALHNWETLHGQTLE